MSSSLGSEISLILLLLIGLLKSYESNLPFTLLFPGDSRPKTKLALILSFNYFYLSPQEYKPLFSLFELSRLSISV
jgi:hypothetical protein